MSSFARGIADSFDATSAVDITILAALIYLALVGLQHVRTGNALRGAVLLGAIYLMARQFNLALTSAALEAFLVLLLVALVMIYREELRRLVERAARLARRRPTVVSGEVTLATLLSDSAFELGEARMGALVVLAGDDPVAPLLTGGTTLSGVPSAPLIMSIFDSSSLGHDGALVIEGGVVTVFGAHLPLSSNVQGFARRGTRHAAALGLSECCDALCIVVSEERGTVSVAKEGTLREVADGPRLTEALREHLGEGGVARPAWRALVTDHHGTKVAALVMSVLAWLVLVYGGQPMHQSVLTPVQWRDVRSGLQVVSVAPPNVRVVVSGVRRDFALASRSPTRVVLSLTGSAAGQHRLRVAPEDVVLAKGLTLKSVAPAEVDVTLGQAGAPAPLSPAHSGPQPGSTAP